MSALLTSPAPAASRVSVVDDVADTGAGGLHCVEALREAGHEVVGVFAPRTAAKASPMRSHALV
ncbi:hypothetical protein [Streptomyces sp. NPDC086777]|uniref:hypothetical protein n=1 Tax=Streptomyces sp. NPDC086777 TaxID=3154866 RepID=UPI00344D8505